MLTRSQRNVLKLIALVVVGYIAAFAVDYVFGSLAAGIFFNRGFRETFGGIITNRHLLVQMGIIAESTVYSSIVLLPTGFLLARASLLSVKQRLMTVVFAAYIFALNRYFVLDMTLEGSWANYANLALMFFAEFVGYWLLIDIGLVLGGLRWRRQVDRNPA